MYSDGEMGGEKIQEEQQAYAMPISDELVQVEEVEQQDVSRQKVEVEGQATCNGTESHPPDS